MVHLNKLLFHQGPLGWVNDLSQIHAYGKTIKHGYFPASQLDYSQQRPFFYIFRTDFGRKFC